MRNRNIFVPILGISVSLHMGKKRCQSAKDTSTLTLVPVTLGELLHCLGLCDLIGKKEGLVDKMKIKVKTSGVSKSSLDGQGRFL